MENLKPLDCIFFAGQSLLSKVIIDTQKVVLSNGTYSHIGLIVNKKCMPSLNVKDENELFCYESYISSKNLNDVLDSERNTGISGVQVRRLIDVIKHNFNDKYVIAVSKLLINPLDKVILPTIETDVQYKNRVDKVCDIMTSIHKKYYNTKYTMNPFRLAAAAFKCCSCCRNGTFCIGETWVFCSQFVTDIYIALGILPKTIDSEQMLPDELESSVISRQKYNPILSKPVFLVQADYENLK